MKRFALLFLAVVLVAPLFLAGCSTRLGDFTIVSTKNYERSLEYRNVGRMEGKDMALVIIGIPTGAPTIEDAVDDAIEAGGGVYLTNAVIRYSAWNVILVGQMGYKVEGDVYAPVSRGEILEEGTETFSLVETENGPVMKSNLTGDFVHVKDITEVMKDIKR